MKNAIIALMLVFAFVGSSYAGDCGNGLCSQTPSLLLPVRKVVNVTKNVVVAPVRAVAAVVTPTQVSCEPVVVADSCCGNVETVSKTVTRYQPVRRRLVNRSTNVSCGCK